PDALPISVVPTANNTGPPTYAGAFADPVPAGSTGSRCPVPTSAPFFPGGASMGVSNSRIRSRNERLPLPSAWRSCPATSAGRQEAQQVLAGCEAGTEGHVHGRDIPTQIVPIHLTDGVEAAIGGHC